MTTDQNGDRDEQIHKKKPSRSQRARKKKLQDRTQPPLQRSAGNVFYIDRRDLDQTDNQTVTSICYNSELYDK